MPSPPGHATLPPRPLARPAPVLRRCACGGRAQEGGECAECRKKRLGLQRSAAAAAAPGFAPPVVHDVLRSPGQPLDAATRAWMEPRFGHSFAHVRVHADGRAAESAAAVSAHAYAVGRDVVFGAGRYAPSTSAGRRLIAHELAHVVQQQGAPAAPVAALEVGAPDAREEAEADRAATATLRGDPPAVAPAGAVRLARAGDDERRPDAGDTAGPAQQADGGGGAPQGRKSDSGFCVRTPFGPGRVRITGCSAAELDKLRILPETGDVPIAPANDTWYDADGVWDGRRPNRAEWFKVSDHCDATLACSGGGLAAEWCCNWAASLIKGTPRWVTDGHAALKNLPK